MKRTITMKTWTTQAEKRLDEYLLERTTREGLEGEDAAELKEDLRRHVYEEVEESPAEVISLMHLETILGKMDAGYRPVVPHGITPAAPRRTGRRFAWAFGVILPAIVLLIEMVSSFCGSILFDPVPTWFHALLVAAVPCLNIWLLKGSVTEATEKWKGAAAGVVLVVCAFYGLLFLPVIHFSVMGLVLLGFGLLPLSPVLAWIASWRFGKVLRKESPAPARFKTGWRMGVTATVLALLLLEGPSIWTRANVESAYASGSSDHAVARLRAFYSERTLLISCYEGMRGGNGGTDIAGWGALGWRMLANTGERAARPDPVVARDIFFRVTGKSFTSVKPPSTGTGLRRGEDPMGEFEFDENVGGDQVAVRLKNLDLKESRFDGHMDSVSEIGYGEWTLIFRNNARNAQEARCQVRLPAGGRVSRLTLWVNGEPREAAFSTVSKVKAAYKEIAVVQQRDPVLVTMAGPDTVMVQCFPVPARGEMKIRFGVTSSLKEGRWELPRIVERNFGMAAGLEHAVWLQGDRDFKLTGADLPMASIQDGEGKSLSAELPATAAIGEGVALEMSSPANDDAVVWCQDRFAKAEERYLIREPRRLRTEGAGKLVMVIDGSVSLAEHRELLASVINDDVIAVLADDSAKTVDAEALRKYRFSGGRNNEPALREAIGISKKHGGLPIVWIYGPQSVSPSQSERLAQLLERGSVLPVIHTVEAVPGPNRLAEVIYRSATQVRGPRLGDAAPFRNYLQELLHGSEARGWAWRRSAFKDGLEGKEVWDQLARLWAVAAAEDVKQSATESDRSAMAARYQLVTAVSGAVVLENDEQYKQHGLSPVDPDAAPHVPSVPEPSSVLLILLTATAALVRRKR